jgi:hypothetical protein
VAAIPIETTSGPITIEPAACESVTLSTGDGQRTVNGSAVHKMFEDWCAANRSAALRQADTIARAGEEYLKRRRREG